MLSLTLNESYTYKNIYFQSIKNLNKSRTKESCGSGLYLFASINVLLILLQYDTDLVLSKNGMEPLYHSSDFKEAFKVENLS